MRLENVSRTYQMGELAVRVLRSVSFEIREGEFLAIVGPSGSGVSEVRSRIQFSATVDLESATQPLNSVVLSLPEQRRPIINDIVLRQGDYFSEQRLNEVIINDAFARAHNIYPGQWIHLLLNNRRQPLFVVGTAISSEFVYLLGPGALVPDPEHFGVFYVKQRFAEEVFDFDGAANQLVGRLAPGGHERLDSVLRQAELVLEPFGVSQATPRSQQVSHQFVTNEIAGLGVSATIIPSVFLTVAAVGMTLIYAEYFAFPDLRSEFSWYTHGVGMAVSLICAVLGSLHGSRDMLRIQPAEAMRAEPPRPWAAACWYPDSSCSKFKTF